MLQDVLDMINTNEDKDNTVMVMRENVVRIYGDGPTTIITAHEFGDISIKQEGDTDMVYLFPDEAAALHSVLGAMLNS